MATIDLKVRHTPKMHIIKINALLAQDRDLHNMHALTTTLLPFYLFK